MTLPFADQATLIIPTTEEPPPDVVRAWVQSTLVAVPLLPRLHVALVTEELVANARGHAPPPYVLRLVLDATQRALRVLVDDCAGDTGVDWQTRTGLGLVDALSRDWGVELRAGAKTVWAEVALGVRGRLAVT